MLCYNESGDKMITAIELKDGLGSLEFGTDPFHKPCVYYVDNRFEKNITKLEDQLLILKELSEVYDANDIYDDFLSIVEHVKKKIRKDDVLMIEKLGEKYGTKVVVALLILYMQMVLDEQNYRFGKERTCVQLYYLFFEDYSIGKCVHMLDDMDEKDIKNLCKEKDILA